MSVHVAIIDGPVPRTSNRSAAPDIGAMLCFEGIVRSLEGDQPLAGLVYETYDPMAERSLDALARSALERFDISSIHVLHSRGFVACGQASLLVEIASQHRVAGLDAMAWYIDRLKQEVPIWKHLRLPDGRTVPAPVAMPPTLGSDPSQG